ncbi:MAG TPA: HAMP domain-containing sensor histidine kinase [Solirubrobacteraceae bacterium]|jgi:signal transduction histidine kinase|nr:HAMP domain-containing sensor histidine kinase [Solirubrobacteraceae bacterium]
MTPLDAIPLRSRHRGGAPAPALDGVAEGGGAVGGGVADEGTVGGGRLHPLWSSIAVLLLALVPACAVMAAIGGSLALTVEILLPVGLLALALAHLADSGRLRLATLHLRFELAVGLALGQLLAVVAIGAAVMFVSSHDAWMTVAILLFAAVVATRAAQLLLGAVVRDVHATREGLHALERGEREIAIEARSGRELEDLADTADRMIGALAAEERARDTADAARRQVVAAVSHDLRTPLSALRLLTQALEDELVDPATARRYLRTMGAHVRTLGTLIDDLFELSCLDAGEVAWSTGAVDLAALVGEACELVRPATEAAGVALRTELPPDLVPAEADADKLRRVLLNLLQNALRHTPPDGSVAISAAAVDGAVEVEVADTGAGIPPEDRPHVFEPFYRGGGDAARSGPGSGLGLAIARAIVEAHGGRIWLADSGSGTRVRFTLPTVSPAARPLSPAA